MGLMMSCTIQDNKEKDNDISELYRTANYGRIVDMNNNGILDGGDAMIFYYDTNKDGNMDTYTVHRISPPLFNSENLEARIEFSPTPTIKVRDTNHNGTYDTAYRGFGVDGVPSDTTNLIKKSGGYTL